MAPTTYNLIQRKIRHKIFMEKKLIRELKSRIKNNKTKILNSMLKVIKNPEEKEINQILIIHRRIKKSRDKIREHFKKIRTLQEEIENSSYIKQKFNKKNGR